MSTRFQATASNPFATRFIRPGALPFLFPPGQSAEQLVDAFRTQNWRGAIIGPHGTGKSTLLAALEPALQAAGRRRWTIRLRDAQRSLPSGWKQQAAEAKANLIVIDGYEQLSWSSRLRVRFVCCMRGWGLLATAHRDVGLPVLFRTTTNPQLALQIVAALQSRDRLPIDSNAVIEQFHATGGNLREMLFRLYDVWEQRPPAGGAGRSA